MNSDGTCPRCRHVMSGHALLSPADPMLGGIILCPVKDCQCFATWGGAGPTPEQRLPPRLIQEMRELVQNGHI